MDKTERKMTKIARELNKLTVQAMKEKGIGTAEFDFIHLVRHHPGITQAQLREELKIDKGAAARRAASLEAKGYLIRRDNPEDKRSQLLYATKKAEGLKNSKVSIKSTFYEWLMGGTGRIRNRALLRNAGSTVSEIEKRKPVWIFAGKGTDGQGRKGWLKGRRCATGKNRESGLPGENRIRSEATL